MGKRPLPLLVRLRGAIQAAAALLTNIHLPNFLSGRLYQGNGKRVCVPGLNCYSCPGAAGACPIGAFQAVVGSSGFRFCYYITGLLILLGVLLGRFICGFLCPFGWLQELLHHIPSPKLSSERLKPLRYLKYAVLLVMVVLLPTVLVNELGMGDPIFCKYLCPQGILEGAIPLALVNTGIRSALGALFTWKAAVLAAVILLSVLFWRPFCKWLCPLGAFYALFNRVSLFQMQVNSIAAFPAENARTSARWMWTSHRMQTTPSASAAADASRPARQRRSATGTASATKKQRRTHK